MSLSISAGKVCVRFFVSGPFAVLLSFVLFFSAFPASAQKINGEGVFDQIIDSAAAKHQVPGELIRAMIWRESSFRPLQTGASGEIGLMQIKMITVQDWAAAHNCMIPAKADLYDPVLNIEIGTWYIAKAMKHWQDHPRQIIMALCEYNAGRSGFRRLRRKYRSYEKISRATIPGRYSQAIFSKYIDYKKEKMDLMFAELSR